MSTDNEIEDVQGAQENVVNSAVKEKEDRKITSVSPTPNASESEGSSLDRLNFDTQNPVVLDIDKLQLVTRDTINDTYQGTKIQRDTEINKFQVADKDAGNGKSHNTYTDRNYSSDNDLSRAKEINFDEHEKDPPAADNLQECGESTDFKIAAGNPEWQEQLKSCRDQKLKQSVPLNC